MLADKGNLDTLFTDLKISCINTSQYKERFKDVFIRSKNNPTYQQFLNMLRTDQEIRIKIDTCRDSCDVYEFRRINIDRQNFDFLHKYLQDHPWPALSEGSLYAYIIALHDHGYYDVYLPILRKALADGKINRIRNIEDWQHLDSVNADMEKYFLRSKKLQFNVTYFLHDQLIPADELRRMQDSIHIHCPIKYAYVVYMSENKNEYLKWIKEHSKVEKIRELELRQFDGLDLKCSILPFQQVFLKSDSKKAKLMLYFIY